jgi:uncharacterized protein RhaS with RHS repeats
MEAGPSYDAAGNMSGLTLTTLGNGVELYSDDWDEFGRLSRVERDNVMAGGGIVEALTYDAAGNRVSIARTTMDAAGTASPTTYTVKMFDSLVLENATFPDANSDYEHDDATEHVYVNAGGELLGHAFRAQTLPTAAGYTHMFMPMGDRLGSTSFVRAARTPFSTSHGA